MPFTIVSTPAFMRRVKKLKKDHKNRIKKFIEKIEKEGLHTLKILTTQNDYILGEIKSSKPPYRLYVVYDQKTKIFYALLWESKNKQKKIIRKLTKQLKMGVDIGINYIFGEE